MTWAKAKFQSLFAEPSRNGVYKSKEHHGSGAKIINMGELFAHDRIGTQKMARLRMTDQELAKSSVINGDLLFGRRSLVEEGAGRCALAWNIDEPTTFESSIIRVRLDQQIANPVFYFYYFRSPAGRARIRSIVSGATVKGIRSSDLQQIEIDHPPLDVQARIALQLSDFDNLIETNRRRITLLEESARLLYREWFVKLRFPGYESVAWQEGLPVGWRRAKFSDICKQVREQVIPASVTPETPYLSMEHMTPKSICLGAWETAGKVSSSKILFRRGDVLFGRIRPYFHKVGLAQVDGITSTDMIVTRPNNEKLRSIVLLAMSADEFVEYAVTTSNGTKMPRADWNVLKNWEIILPENNHVIQFAEKTQPMLDAIEIFSRQNIELTKARDELLPKLMSGAIKV